MCVTGKPTGEVVLDPKMPKILLNDTISNVSHIQVCIREEVYHFVSKTGPPKHQNLIKIIEVKQDSDLKCF